MIQTFLAAACGLLFSAASASAVTIDWVTVGNPDNDDDSTGFGGVADTYRISKYEVTNAQYADFLNAVAVTDTNELYNTKMGSNARGGITQSGSSGNFTYSVKTDMGNKPVNYVSFFDAMRFVNWLENGTPTGAQGLGTTEDGTYTISDGLSETRASGASYFLPSEDEWYKAAYHQPNSAGGDTDDYWPYPTGSNTDPTAVQATSTGDGLDPDDGSTTPAVGNHANFDLGADWNSQDGNVTTVGTNGDPSYYGTFDQGGNLWEWNETLIGSNRGLRGGSGGSDISELASSFQSSGEFAGGEGVDFFDVGFRVASPFSEGPLVPEPESIAIGLIGALLLAWKLHRGLRKTSL